MAPMQVRAWLIAIVGLLATSAFAQDRGFRLHRYEGTAAGTTQFLVDRPWYSSTRLGAFGVTFDYSHAPLVAPVPTGRGFLSPIVEHAVVGHVDLASSFFDRLLVSASLPVTLLERGTAETLSGVGPLQTVGIGDPRVGLMFRVAGKPEEDPISLNIGVDGWVPIGGAPTHQGDVSVRLMPRLVLAGAISSVRWAFDGGFLFRPYSSFGPPALSMIAASEARGGLALGLSLADNKLTIGPEAQFAVQVLGENAFKLAGMNLEVLGGLHYLFGDHLLIGLAGGSAFFGIAGTPDARGMIRIAWLPGKPTEKPAEPVVSIPPGSEQHPLDDEDGDGVNNKADRCPYEPETVNGVRDQDGCPDFDSEKELALARVLAAREAPVRKTTPVVVDAGTPATPVAPVSPAAVDAGQPTVAETASVDAGAPIAVLEQGTTFASLDADQDGIPDEADRCPASPEDLDGFEDEDGCPEADNDTDAVTDAADKCPDEGETINGVDDGDGCPDMAKDADRDGVADALDRCPFEPETIDGVRDDDGCPEMPLPGPAKVVATLAKLLAPPPSVPTVVVPAPVATTAPETAVEPAGEVDGDQDGTLDEVDRCPLTPEDVDGFEDEDGCPELDNDEDGVLDPRDQCPLDAETVNAWKDDDGCPDGQADADNDGVDYDKDRCPLEPGDASDGCPHAPLPALALPGFPGLPAPVQSTATATATTTTPEPTPAASTTTADLDGDSVPDEADACPMSAEERDDFEDEDGCPEPDNDRDGIADSADKCPLAAEVINGKDDTDGCPDVGASAVTIKGNAVVINGVVQFKTGSANLERASLPLLKQVAGKLLAAASISIEIQGHTDDIGNAAGNIKLSKRRAEAIRAVLIKGGVAPNRLIANGYGPTRPRASNKTKAGRDLNRRVEFLILGESK